MTTRDPASYTLADLADPSIDAGTLALLAAERPDLWVAISRHPNCYPELGAWLAQHLAPPAPGPVAPAPAPTAVTGAQWAANFQQLNGREPFMSEYQSAVANGEIHEDLTPQTDSVHQMSAGAKQLATGAKEFLAVRVAPAARSVQQSVNERVAPAAGAASRSVQQTVKERNIQAQGGAWWWAWAPIAIPVVALLGLFSLFLPVATAKASGWGMSYSEKVSYFDKGSAGIGVVLLLGMLVVIVAGVVAVMKSEQWAKLTVAVAGIVMGLASALLAFGVMGSMSGMSGSGYGFSSSAKVGPGAVLLAFAGVVMLLASIVALLPAKYARKPAAEQGQPGQEFQQGQPGAVFQQGQPGTASGDGQQTLNRMQPLVPEHLPGTVPGNPADQPAPPASADPAQ